MCSKENRFANLCKFKGEGSGMIKKVLIGTGAGVVVLGLLFGRDAVGIVTTATDQLSQSVRDSVPVEFEIERARGMIKDLDPEIRRNMHVIAKEEVEVEKLEKQIAESREQLAESQEKIIRLQNDIDTIDDGSYYYGDRRYTKGAGRGGSKQSVHSP